MTKDENRYLREWVAFHRTQGYTKFYIYDNMSNIPVADTLSKEISEGLVNVVMWADDKVGRHHRAMDNFLNRKDVETVWASLTDTDEFSFGINSPLDVILKKYENQDALKLGWLCFGSSGHKRKPKGLVMESYTKRGDSEDVPGGKSVVKFGIVKKMGDCHNPRLPHKALLLDRSEAVINHYITRSRQDWMEKRIRGGGNGSKRGLGMFKRLNKSINKHEDLRIQKYTNQTKFNLK